MAGVKAIRPSAVWQMICAQERALIAEVDAIRVSNRPEVIGALFEESFRALLNRMIPSALSIVPGFIVDQDGKESSHFDALIVNNGYPFLSSIGPHRYVMSSAVVSAMELTTRLDTSKLSSVLKKSKEIERISRKLYPEKSSMTVGFWAVVVDCKITSQRLRQKFAEQKPSCDLYTLRPPIQHTHPVHCWMEGGKNGTAYVRDTESPLADLISMQFQDSLYSLSARVRDLSAVGRTMNHHIHWGTVALSKSIRADQSVTVKRSSKVC